MNEKKLHSCCFFGHRKIEETQELTERLTNVIESLILEKEVNIFYFGSKSDFDRLCLETVTNLKEKYPHIKRIYVRSDSPYISGSYKESLMKRYDDTYYPEKIKNAGKFTYVERNCEMIDKSSYCVCYYDENYLPPRRKNSKRDLFDYQPRSGTAIAYDYALKKKRFIINVI